MEPYELYILDDVFRTVLVLDTYESFIWTERYREAGDFELYLPASSDMLVYAIPDYFVWIKDSDRLMIIEQVEIDTDVENGNHLKISGRSLESLLARRIIWNQTSFVDGENVQDIIAELVDKALINTELEARAIPNFIFAYDTDPIWDTFTFEAVQYLGENLYDVVIDLLAAYDIGFKIVYDFDLEVFIMSLFVGTDRSYAQSTYPFVVFSPEYDNLISSNYIEGYQNYHNVNLIKGEDPESSSGRTRKFVYVNDGGDIEGLARREMFTDGSSLNQEYTDENDQDVVLTDAQYISVLRSNALEELAKDENRISRAFDGEMTAYNLVYGQDYFIGDIVQAINEYHLGSSVRITEMIFSQSTSEITMYPTFTMLVEGD